jgi:hypothetical protein
MSKSDFVFFMEKDFNLDNELGLERIKQEILISVWLLERGIQVLCFEGV